jgi:hypothetical protein
VRRRNHGRCQACAVKLGRPERKGQADSYDRRQFLDDGWGCQDLFVSCELRRFQDVDDDQVAARLQFFVANAPEIFYGQLRARRSTRDINVMMYLLVASP